MLQKECDIGVGDNDSDDGQWTDEEEPIVEQTNLAKKLKKRLVLFPVHDSICTLLTNKSH